MCYLQLGNALDVIHSELLPKEKANIIKRFKGDGPTAMVGDGLNDTPALATADIGISMGVSGSALATETGNVILMSNDMRKIPKAIKLAKKSHAKVVQNVILSIGTKTAILGLAFTGHPLVWAAVLADVGTCLLVILNSMLLLRGTDHRHGKKCCKSSKLPCFSTKHGKCNRSNGRSSHRHDHHHDDHRCHVVDDRSSSRENRVHKHCCSEKNNVPQQKEHKFHHNPSNQCEKNQVEKESNGDSSRKVAESNCNCHSHHVAIDIHEDTDCERVEHK